MSQQRYPLVPTTSYDKTWAFACTVFSIPPRELWNEMPRRFRFCLFHFLSVLFHNCFILCQSYFIPLPVLFHNFSFFGQSHFILLPALFHNFIILLPVFFHNLYVYLVMMGSNYKTCDLLIASIYMLIAQLSYIMTSNTNKCKDQKSGVG